MTAWSDRNGLDSSNVTTSLFDGNVEKYEFGQAAGEEGIETHYWINGLEHQWPSTEPNDDGGATYFVGAFGLRRLNAADFCRMLLL